LLDAGFPPGVLTIDDRWSPDYGTWEFDTSTFADPTAMVQRLHDLGFTVMLWLVPFVSPDIATFRYLRGRPRRSLLRRKRAGDNLGRSMRCSAWRDVPAASRCHTAGSSTIRR
jgi:hypothetical protein